MTASFETAAQPPETPALAEPRTALANMGRQIAEADRAVRIEEAPLRGMVQVKGAIDDPGMSAVLSSELCAPTPGPLRAALTLEPSGAATGALWMAPDEIMLFTSYETAAETAARLDAALAEAPRLVEVVSDARTIFRLTGKGAREVIAKGAPIDLHAFSFGPGDFRRTKIGAVAAGVYQLPSETEIFEVFCFRSYAPYLAEWLSESAKTGALPGVLDPEPR